MLAKLIGVKKSVSKEGVSFFNYFYIRNFSDYDKENCSVEGVQCGMEFSRTDFGVRKDDVVNMVYEPGFKGMATLSDIVPVKVPFEEEQKATSPNDADKLKNPGK